MNGAFLSGIQRQQRDQFPEHIHDNELIQYYLLSEDTFQQTPIKSPSHARLWGAMSLSDSAIDQKSLT
jgi:hypothetical protein